MCATLLVCPREERLAWADAGGHLIVVRGSSRIDAEVTRVRGRFAVRGVLLDDAAKPIRDATLTLKAKAEGDGAPVRLIAERCDEGRGGAAPKVDREEDIVLTTDDAGRFCVRLDVRHPNGDGAPLREPSATSYVAHLAFEGGGLVDGTAIDLPVDLARRSLALHFDPEPRVIALDDARLDLQAVAWLDDDEEQAEGLRSPAADLPLVLRDEAGRVLANATTDAAGRARFASLVPSRLGPPGRGELRVEFAGNANVGPSAHVASIERHAKVDLALAQAPQAGVPEEGIEIHVSARARAEVAGDGGAGPLAVRSGAVEARASKDPSGGPEVVLGAAPIEDGSAHVVITFASGDLPLRADGVLPLRLHYVSETPWLEPGEEASALVPIKAPSPLRHVPLLLAGAGVVLWLALGRTRQRGWPPRNAAPAPRATPNVAPAPHIEIVRAAEPHEGWAGRVVDAHDLDPVPGAEVRIERPHFQGIDVLARTSTDIEGRFALQLHEEAALTPREGDKLVVTAPLHARIARPLPAPSELVVGVVQRKRALLDRMIAWARSRGRPYDATPEPTPGHVRKVAGAESDVARWAESVERAAYEGGVVDAQREAEVERLAPPDLDSSSRPPPRP